MRTALVTKLPVPGVAKTAIVAVLLRVFAGAFDVEPPRVLGASSHQALYAFGEFSAACMEEALKSPAYAARKRVELESRARSLGSQVRRVLRPRDEELPALVQRFYDTIGIAVEARIPGELRFRRCYFAGRYTPALCAFMSAFDSGFVGGLAGGGSLRFKARLTEGAPCCLAVLSDQKEAK